MPLQVTHLSDYSSNEILETEDEVDEGLQDGVPHTNMDGIKYLYREET